MKDNRRLFQRFNRVISSPPMSEEAAGTAFTQIQEIIYLLALNAGAMEVELEEEGPVRHGDDCLFGAALNLKLIAGIFPDAANRERTERRALRHFRSVVEYYPDSELADEARGDIADLQ